MKRPEQILQKTICQHLTVRGHYDLYWWHHPAGGYRSPIEAAIFKSIGAKSGLLDLFLLCQGKLYGLELKPEAGYPPLKQPRTSSCGRRAPRSTQLSGSTLQSDNSKPGGSYGDRRNEPKD